MPKFLRVLLLVLAVVCLCIGAAALAVSPVVLLANAGGWEYVLAGFVTLVAGLLAMWAGEQ